LTSDRVRTIGLALALAALFSAVCGGALMLLAPNFAPEIERVLVFGPPLQSRDSGMNFIQDGNGNEHVDTEFIAGMRLVIFGVLMLGLPLAVCASTLASRRRSVQWGSSWGSAFQAGFVLQFSCLVLAACAWLLAATQGFAFILVQESPWLAAFLAVDVLVSALALPSWRLLQNSTTLERPTSVTVP
jgi:hypothetical protein